MEFTEEDLPIELPVIDTSIIKVIGVGGGGGNAVNHMYRQGITDVSFVVCNTDNQALLKSPIPTKIQLGNNTTAGLGAGNKPEIARQAAEESIERIQNMLSDNTRMVFITAGMGGGTGTGSSPVVAEVAYDMGILTVGIVTIPFAFEGKMKIRQALEGVASLSRHVDAILVINNEKLKEIYPDLNLSNAFAKADDVLTNAAKGIAEIITIEGYINIDFADVYSIMKDGKVAIMNTGYAEGENRLTMAIQDALNSPLLNTSDVSGARKVLLSLYCSHENQIKMEEIDQIHQFMSRVGENVEVIWGITFDDSLEKQVKITLIATGFDVSDIPGMPDSALKNDKDEPDELAKGNGKNERAESEADIQKAMDRYYGRAVNQDDETEIEMEIISAYEAEIVPESEPEFEIEPDQFVFTLEELEDEKKLKDIENIPAWKRKLFKR